MKASLVRGCSCYDFLRLFLTSLPLFIQVTDTCIELFDGASSIDWFEDTLLMDNFYQVERL
jgi:hypothetical protein